MTAGLSTAHAQCNSAFVYAIVGAQTRGSPEVHAQRACVEDRGDGLSAKEHHHPGVFARASEEQTTSGGFLAFTSLTWALRRLLLDAAEKEPRTTTSPHPRVVRGEWSGPQHIDHPARRGQRLDRRAHHRQVHGIFKSISTSRRKGGAEYRKTITCG